MKKDLKEILHDILARDIAEHPEKIGLSSVIRYQEDVQCKDKKDKLVCAPDIVFYLENNNMVLAEVKLSNHKNAIRNLRDQLSRDYKYYKTYHGKECVCIGLYGVQNPEFETMILKDKLNVDHFENRGVKGELGGYFRGEDEKRHKIFLV